MVKTPDVGLKAESIGTIDLNVAERQSMLGYVPTFLNEHQMIMAVICNAGIPEAERFAIASMAIRTNVSLITDKSKREELWGWYDKELSEWYKKEPNASNIRKKEISYELAMILLGRVMDFVGVHLSKPVEVGTE